MLSPRLTNCIECANIPNLLKNIECKISILSKDLYNNTVFSLNKTIKSSLLYDLLNYKRILSYKMCNDQYAAKYSINQIASQVKLITSGAKCDCSCMDVPLSPDPFPISHIVCTAVGFNAHAYFCMERRWMEDNPQNSMYGDYGDPGNIFNFELMDCTLDGVQFASNQSININAPTDLMVGRGIFPQIFVQNINDWLNSFSNIASSGFKFYDDMSSITIPSVTSTYNIIIKETTNSDVFYYRWSRIDDNSYWDWSEFTEVGNSHLWRTGVMYE